MIQGRKYAIYAKFAGTGPFFVGLAETMEEARRIKFDAELAGFTDAIIIDGHLNEVA